MLLLQRRAIFTRKPRVLSEISILAAVENLKPIKVEKIIILPKENYRNFITDMTVERLFLRKYNSLCKIDDEGVWHCLLVVPQGSQVGILVMADNLGFSEYAAQYWGNREELHSNPQMQQCSRSLYSSK